jgi:neutral amino acid transport system permease protein
MRRSVVALAAVVALLALAPPVGAQEEPSQDEETPAEGGQTQGEEAITGTLRYEDDAGESVFVEGVDITVESGDGTFSETVASDAEGRFELAVPGPGRYSATIDPDALPDEVSLRDEDRSTLSFTVSPRQVRPVQFRLQFGEGESGGSQFFDDVVDKTVEGIRFGLIIAICAIGLSLIFGTTGLVNFAHGELVTFGALIAFLFNVTMGIHLLIAAPLAILVGAAAGLGLDFGFWRPLTRRGTGLIAMLVISIGVGLLVRYMFVYQFGGDRESYDQYALQRTIYEFGPIRIVPRDLVTILLAVAVLVGVASFLQMTRTGKAMRAVADNRDLAEASGIDVERVVAFVWAAGAGLAALGGVLLGLAEGVDWLMGFRLLLLMFAGVTLGGLGTAYGALVGSLVVGLFVQLSTLWVAPELKNIGALLILILILLVRPQGILGQAERVG